MESYKLYLKIIMIKDTLKKKDITEYRIYRLTGEEKSLIGTKAEGIHSIIILFFPYLTSRHDFGGNLSVYTKGTDYHIWVRSILEDLAEELKLVYPEDSFSVQVDIGQANEKELAYRSGLGRRGMNSLIINEKYGSYGFLGLIFTSAELQTYMTPPMDCCGCMKCMEKCPGKAIKGDFTIDRDCCASKISQKKEELTEKEKKILKKSKKIFGCDICQMVCPHNEKIAYADDTDFLIDSLTRMDIEPMSGKSFLKTYGDRSFSWRGKKIIQRNIDIIEDKE